jgi:hypothetical protein
MPDTDDEVQPTPDEPDSLELPMDEHADDDDDHDDADEADEADEKGSGATA